MKPVSAGVTLRAGATGLTDLQSGEKVAVTDRRRAARVSVRRRAAPARHVPAGAALLPRAADR
jgi:hypothetical protein